MSVYIQFEVEAAIIWGGGSNLSLGICGWYNVTWAGGITIHYSKRAVDRLESWTRMPMVLMHHKSWA